jgi:hypothetical protein
VIRKVVIFAQHQVALWLTFKADEVYGTCNTHKDDTNERKRKVID